MNFSSVIKKIATTSALASLLLATGFASATPSANYYGDNVSCAGVGSCYDFTVYDNSKITGSNTGTNSNNGFFEGFVTYGGSSPATPTLTNAYFISTGLASPGATISSWAPIISNPALFGTFDGDGVQSGTASLTTTGSNAGKFANNNNLSFQVGSTYYAITLSSNGGAQIYFSSISSADAITSGNQLNGNGYFYTSTNKGVNSLGTSSNGNFGGQIAPEMSPLMSFNVFALLGCLFLLLTSKKYFVKSKSDTSSALSIA